MTLDDHTRPERFVEVHRAKDVRARIQRAGGCAFCLHRDREVDAWGRSICGLSPQRRFPGCIDADVFALDHDRATKGVGDD